MSLPYSVSPLAAGPPQAPGRRNPRSRKVASGGLRSTRATRPRTSPYASRDFSLFRRQVRRDAALAQTNTGLPQIPALSTGLVGPGLPQLTTNVINLQNQGKLPIAESTVDVSAAWKGKRETILEGMTLAAGTQYGSANKFKQGVGMHFDCSGFVTWAYGLAGVKFNTRGMTGSLATQIVNSPGVSQTSNPIKGDLAYWSKPFAHIMIVTGNGMVYGASSPRYKNGIDERPERYFGPPTYYRVGALDEK